MAKLAEYERYMKYLCEASGHRCRLILACGPSCGSLSLMTAFQ